MVTKSFSIKTGGNCDVIDITSNIEEIVGKSNIEDGICVVFAPGSTMSICINENDVALINDFKAFIKTLVPEMNYKHPSNAHSHLRSWFLGSSQVIPVHNKQLQLGTWQSIFLVDFDIHPRERTVVVEIIEG